MYRILASALLPLALLSLRPAALLAGAAKAGATARLEGSAIVLRNERCRLELDAGTGAIRSLRPGPASLQGPWFEVVEEDRAGLHPWETWKRGAETTFAGGPAKVACSEAGGAATARIAWSRPNGLRIEGHVVLLPRDAGPRFRLKVTNTTGAALVDTLRLPVLRGIALDDPEDDWFTWPHTLGARFRARGFKPGEKIETPYPDFLYMQWLDLHDARQGVYAGCLDDYGYSKLLSVGRDQDGRSEMAVTFVGCWIAKEGDSWTTPWVQIASHRGDWRAGADLYRPFAQRAFGPLDAPERVREMPTAQCWLGHHASDGDIGKLFEVQQQGPIHASYLMKSLNTSIPEGWDGFRGSALELDKSFRRIRELGGSPALFTFDRAPLMGRPNYAEHAGRWTAQRRDGSFAEGFRDMMPSPFAPDLVRARVGEAERWVRSFGLGEIHFDTAATTGPLAGPSYHPGFPQRPNEVPHYFKKLYRAIRDACRKHNPEFILRAEHCADFFYPEFLTSTAHHQETVTLVLQHNYPADAQPLPILFRYTLPRHAALQMPSQSNDDFWTYGHGMGYGFHGGGPSWTFNPGVREPESPPGSLLERYAFYDEEWRRYWDFRVGFWEAVVEGERSDTAAEALVDGEWVRCDFPGPAIAVTHSGGGREVTLGQWYDSRTELFGQRFVKEPPKPRPIVLRVPTRLANPQVRLFGERGEIPAKARIAGRTVEVAIQDPRCFALEVFSGPSIALKVAELAYSGRPTTLRLEVRQPRPQAGRIDVRLPAGWPKLAPVAVPAQARFAKTLRVKVPAGIFGRNYPIKAVLRSGTLLRTTAAHLKVMDPLTVLYSFDALGPNGPAGSYCVDPGKRARLTVTCVNNTPAAVDLAIRVAGDQVSAQESKQVPGVPSRSLGEVESSLGRWTEGKAGPPPNAWVLTRDFDCSGVPRAPIRLSVLVNGRPAFAQGVLPRTRVMDLNGEWRVSLTPLSQAKVGGAERLDNLDTEAVTPDVWDGGWRTMAAPIRLAEDERKGWSWGIYRRLVFVPAEWQGTDIRLRLPQTGGPWGPGGTLNLVYVNGWPAGRIGTGGECSLSSFLVFGGWNLLAVASSAPNSLVDPYLFVHGAPDPGRIRPAEPGRRPDGAFLLLGNRNSGQGIGTVFMDGIPEGDHRRTNVAAGGEQVFIYFTVADAFIRDPNDPVEIEVEYLDRGTQPFGLDYDSKDPAAPVNGAFKGAPEVLRTNTGEWRRHVFVLPDARLANREHISSDFRIWAKGDDLRLRRVEVRRVP